MHSTGMLSCLRQCLNTARKRSFGRGNIFTSVCKEFCSQGVCLAPPGGGVGGGRVETPPGTATAAGGTHPTGMHSCLIFSKRSSYPSVVI